MINFRSVISAGKQVVDLFKDAAEESIGYIENLNLFEVSMGSMTDKAMEFQEKMHNAFGTNISEMMKYQGLFNQMSKSMGITNDASYLLSENFTKLGYDLSSLYNISTSSAMEKLRAGLAGQTKPLRDLGLDITQQSLQPIVDELGIDRSVKQLSQAEKMILRYIAVLRQASAAQGDFARTVETPANQLKILSAQFQELKRSAGNLFFNLLSGALPYLNAFIMMLKEILNMIAELLGFQLPNLNADLRVEVGVDDLTDGLDEATGSAQKLKNLLFGFDEINNITLPESSSGGSSGSSVGGIDDRLLDAMEEYDNLMGSVSLKANEIKENWLKWLGFTRDANGELEFSWDNMDGIAKILTVILGAVTGFKVLKNIVKHWKSFKEILNGISNLKTSKFFKDLTTTTKASTRTGAASVTTWSNVAKTFAKVATAVGGILTAIDGANRILNTFDGIVKNADTAIKDLNKNILSGVAGFTEMAAGGALIGSAFGPAGAVIGTIAGAIAGCTVAWVGYKNAIQEIADGNIYGTITLSTEELANMQEYLLSSIDDTSESYATFRSNLESTADSFQKAYDNVDNLMYKYENFGTELTGVTGQSIIDGIKDTCEKATGLIDTNSNGILDILMQRFENSVAITEKEQKEMVSTIVNGSNLRKSKIELAEQDIYDIYEKAMAERGYLNQEEIEAIKKHYKTIAELTQSEVDSATREINRIISNSNKTNNTLSKESMEKYLEMLKDSYEKAEEATENSYQEQLKANKEAADAIYDNTIALGESQIEAQEAYNETLNKLNDNSLFQREQNQKKYSEALTNLNSTMVQEIVKKYDDLNTKQSEQLTEVEKQEKETLQNILNDLSEAGVKWVQYSKNYGGKTYSAFKDAFSVVDLAEKVKFSNNTLNKIAKDAGSTIANGITSGMKNTLTYSNFPTIQATLNANGVQTNMGNIKFSAYATGGFPDIGEMFIAREAGPELVGQIGRKNAVVNNSQIVESISTAVSNSMYSAVKSAMQSSNSNSGTMKITGKWNGKSILDIVIDGINEKSRQTGEFAFDIPM